MEIYKNSLELDPEVLLFRSVSLTPESPISWEFVSVDLQGSDKFGFCFFKFTQVILTWWIWRGTEDQEDKFWLGVLEVCTFLFWGEITAQRVTQLLVELSRDSLKHRTKSELFLKHFFFYLKWLMLPKSVMAGIFHSVGVFYLLLFKSDFLLAILT